MRAVFTTLVVVTALSSQALAECGNLCDIKWWRVVTASALKAELDAIDVSTAKDQYNRTPLHYAAIDKQILRFQVQFGDVYASRMRNLWPALRDTLRPKRPTIGTIRLQPGPTDEIRVKISKLTVCLKLLSQQERYRKLL